MHARGRELAIVCHRWPWGPGGAITLGNVILHTGDSLDSPCKTYAHNAGHGDEPTIVLADHERAHVYQYMVLGPLFLPMYLLCGGISAGNRYERDRKGVVAGKGVSERVECGGASHYKKKK